jgi:hypothetical protein
LSDIEAVGDAYRHPPWSGDLMFAVLQVGGDSPFEVEMASPVQRWGTIPLDPRASRRVLCSKGVAYGRI